MAAYARDVAQVYVGVNAGVYMCMCAGVCRYVLVYASLCVYAGVCVGL